MNLQIGDDIGVRGVIGAHYPSDPCPVIFHVDNSTIRGAKMPLSRLRSDQLLPGDSALVAFRIKRIEGERIVVTGAEGDIREYAVPLSAVEGLAA